MITHIRQKQLAIAGKGKPPWRINLISSATSGCIGHVVLANDRIRRCAVGSGDGVENQSTIIIIGVMEWPDERL